jgi:hypothetical protein
MTVELEWEAAAVAAAAEAEPTSASDLLLYQTRLGPNFRAILDGLEARHLANEAVLQSMPEAFDPTQAVGAQQDIIGARLGRRRLGSSDARYELLLQIQVQLILSSQGGPDALMTIVGLLTGLPATEYYEVYPAHASIGAAVPIADTNLLTRLLEEAKVGGVSLHLHAHQTAGAVLLGDTTDGDVEDPGTGETTLGDEGAAAYPAAAIIEV